MLQLPPSLAILSAQILTLRLTVPADLYQSGILVEAQGVEVCVSADLEEQAKAKESGHKVRRSRRSRHPKGIKVDWPRSTQSRVHDPGGSHTWQPTDISEDGEGFSEHLPTTDDLAKSFLQSEPQERKAELKAALARSQYLDQSQTASDYSDGSVELGLGNAISLPGFLAEFLKGVGDRIQAKIQDVVLDLNLKLDLPSQSSAGSGTSDGSELVTLRLTVEDILLNGVTNSPSTGTGDNVPGNLRGDVHDIRRITISNVQAMLISGASLFANLARSTGPVSPETTHMSTIGGLASKPTASFVSDKKTMSSTDAHVAKSLKRNQQDLGPSPTTGYSQPLEDATSSEYDEPLTASVHRPPIRDSRYRDNSVTESFYSGHGHGEDAKGSLADSDELPGSRLYVGSRNADLSPSENCSLRGSLHLDEEAFTASHSRSATPGLDESDHGVDSKIVGNTYNNASSTKLIDSSPSLSASAHKPTSDSSSPASDRVSPSEDLTQSKIFSHEEAESMYMSAISHASMDQKAESTSLPGKWESSDPESEDEGQIASFLAEPFTSQSRGSRSMNRYQLKSGLGFDMEHDKPASDHLEPMDTPVAMSPSSLTADNPIEPELAPQSKDQGNASAHGSESSSANLKGSFTMEKRIMTIDDIVLEIPQGNPRMITNSFAPETSRRFTSGQSPPKPSSRVPHVSIIETPGISSTIENMHNFQYSGQPSVINIGKIQVLGDMALTRLTILITQRLNAIRKQYPSENRQSGVPESTSTERQHIRLKIKEACWKFLDVIKGVPSIPARAKRPTTPPQTFSNGSEVLLKAEIENLYAVHCDPQSTSVLKLSTSKLRFGYALDDILSFDSNLKMRESTRDILAPIDHDLAVTIKQIGDTTEIQLTTLPLYIDLDLRRLDETFSWFGGLSSMLDIGSSVISTVTVKESVPKASRPNKLTRGVHFESTEPSRLVQPRLDEPQNKLTVRIGGLLFDLRGSQASLRLGSTAMKIVKRSEGLGLAVDRMTLSGPYLHQLQSEPSLGIKLANLRIEYLSTPKERDLDRLLALLSPSKDKYERDDDILVETLLRQRRKGGVVRATIKGVECRISTMEHLQCFPVFFEDLKKLSTVAKYLPDDDRPGILTLALIHDLKLEATISGQFGVASLSSQDLEFAYVTLPSLLALGIQTLHLRRNQVEKLVGEATPEEMSEEARLPMVMARFIGNEMEPTAKIKLLGVCVEYHVSTVLALMGYNETADGANIVADMVSSVATLTGRESFRSAPTRISTQVSGSESSTSSKALRFDIALRDCIIGLNPRNSPAKGLLVLTDTHFVGVMPREDEASATLDFRKISTLVIDDAAHVTQPNTASKRRSFDGRRSQLEILSVTGFVSVSTISAAKATMRIVKADGNASKTIDIEIRDELFVIESCADSTQTLLGIVNGLSPPMPPSKELKYQTEVVPVEDMLASFTGNAFATRQGDYGSDKDLPLGLDEGDMVDDEVPQNLEFVSSFYNPDPEAAYEGIADSILEENLESLASPPAVREIGDKNLLESFQDQAQVAPGNMPLDFQDDHFGSISAVEGTAHRWNTKHNTYELNNELRLRSSPVRVRVRDVYIIWNLFDGYDWQHTRDAIAHAVEDVRNKAAERLSRKDKRKSLDPEEEDESVIGDFLFNSIYIGIPANRDPNELARQLNHNLDELTSETGSYATSTTSGSPSRQGTLTRSKSSKLRLRRSKHHKMAFELKSISADVVVFPPGSGETQSSIDVRVQDLEIFDHVPTSTWKKFATYMHDAGERESGTSMVHLEILNVKPVPNLAASEIILKVCPQSYV